MRRSLSLVLAVLVVTSSATSGFGADQFLSGKKLLIKNPPAGAAGNKVVHLAKDATIAVGAAGGAGDPQCSGAGGGGGSLRIIASGGAGDVTIPLACGGWTTNAANSLYKYKDKTNASCTLVLVKNGVLAKAVCKGNQVAIDLNTSMSPVTVVTTLNTQQYCSEFGGTAVKDGSDDKTFLRKESAAPASCPSTSSTTSSTSSSTAVSTTTSTTLGCGEPGQPCCDGSTCVGGGCCISNSCVAQGDVCGFTTAGCPLGFGREVCCSSGACSDACSVCEPL